jgi:DNA-binding beta-propeller fold protein YncE
MTRRRAAPILAVWLLPAFCLAVDPVARQDRFDATIESTIAPPPENALKMPTDVAVDSAGRIYVADGTNDRVVCFLPDGKVEATIAQATGKKLRRPAGIAIDASDRLWIADTGNHRVVYISPDRKESQAVESPAAEGPRGFDPTDIVVTPDLKRTYVADNENHRVVVRDNATGQWTSLGKFGRALGQFQWPFMLCLGGEQYVYVTEVIGARVQQISPTDRWAGIVGAWGVEVGQFYRPKGIVADPRGRIYVSDSSLGVVQVFSARGTFEGLLTDEAGKPRYFQHPMGMCFDAQGKLLVVELKANRVAVVSVPRAEARPTTRPSGAGGR